MKIGEHEIVVVDKYTVKVWCQAVTRQQLGDVLKLMDEWKPAPKFEVGDFMIARWAVQETSWDLDWEGDPIFRDPDDQQLDSVLATIPTWPTLLAEAERRGLNK